MEEQPKKVKLVFTTLELVAVAFACGMGYEFGRIMLLKILQ